jgi:uncharacterized protein with beta-barrel porin domain
MPNYNPQDMALVLRMAKTRAGSAITPQELELMQGVNTAMQPEIAAGNVRMMPQDMMRQQAGAALSPQEMQMMQGQPMNRLAQIQAAANQVLAGGENPEGQRMANVAKYFQGRK